MRPGLRRLLRREPPGEPVTEVNIIPVIDISLVLLVILFVTAPLLSYPNLAVELPRASTPASREDELSVTYTKDGRLAVRAVEVGWEGLEPALKEALAKDPARAVLLRVDKAVPYRVVARLMASAKRAGAKGLGLATDPGR